MADELKKYGFDLISGGTDNHLILIDLTNKHIDGWYAAWALEYAGVVVNRNSVPFDLKSAYYPSGIRLGTPAITTLGLKESHMKKIAGLINKVIDEAVLIMPKNDKILDKEEAKKARAEFKKISKNNKTILQVNREVKNLCAKFKLV